MEYEISNEDVQKYNEADDEKMVADMNDKLCNCIRNDIGQMIQPILYMRKVPEDSVIKTKEDLQMLHTSPIIGTAEVMLNTVTSRLSEDGFKESLGSNACRSLGFNQIDITVNEFTNYIIQNVMISFCSMLDNAGETFKAMVLNTRIKSIVNEELNSSNEMSSNNASTLGSSSAPFCPLPGAPAASFRRRAALHGESGAGAAPRRSVPDSPLRSAASSWTSSAARARALAG